MDLAEVDVVAIVTTVQGVELEEVWATMAPPVVPVLHLNTSNSNSNNSNNSNSSSSMVVDGMVLTDHRHLVGGEVHHQEDTEWGREGLEERLWWD